MSLNQSKYYNSTKDPQTGNLKILDEIEERDSQTPIKRRSHKTNNSEQSHYYPFGLKHQEYSTFGFVSNPIQGVIIAPLTNNPYKYKYNDFRTKDFEKVFGEETERSSEWQDELNLNMYDMDMRQYDPAIARWVVMDPVIHHSMSPYSAFDNNPVFWADPSGADSEFFSAFADQNIDHYGTSNTIDIANIIEANQKMENTMKYIESLVDLPEGYGGNKPQSGGEPDNGDPNKTREQIVENAISKEGNTSYAFNKKKDNFDDASDKCNKFVYDVLKESGADPGTPNGHILNRMIENGSPPTAGQWADPNYRIPGWEVTKTPKPGDVVAAAHNYSNGATGHVAIMVSNTQSIGANATVVRITDFGSNPSHLHSGSQYVYRTYVGNSSSNYSNVNPAYKQYP